MKSLSIVLLGLLLAAPCVAACTPEQQTTFDGMRLSFQLGRSRTPGRLAIAEVAMETLKSFGKQVAFHDLYGERFDPRWFKSDRPPR